MAEHLKMFAKVSRTGKSECIFQRWHCQQENVMKQPAEVAIDLSVTQASTQQHFLYGMRFILNDLRL